MPLRGSAITLLKAWEESQVFSDSEHHQGGSYMDCFGVGGDAISAGDKENTIPRYQYMALLERPKICSV